MDRIERIDPILDSYRRTVNWVEDTSRSLAAGFPELRQANAMYMTIRLSRTLFERLPPDIGFELMDLLPEALCLRDPEYDSLMAAAAEEPDLSIGYPDLVETAQHSLIEATGRQLDSQYFEKVVDFFLWSFAQELSPELKLKISENLPVDIRTRMNLYSGHTEGAKVA